MVFKRVHATIWHTGMINAVNTDRIDIGEENEVFMDVHTVNTDLTVIVVFRFYNFPNIITDYRTSGNRFCCKYPSSKVFCSFYPILSTKVTKIYCALQP